MKLIRDLDDLPDRFRLGAMTIGNFDGVHQGHARIVDRLIRCARRFGGTAVVLTFDPHPARILRPKEAPPPLCWTERKAELLAELGVDAMIAYPATEGFLRLDAREFFEQIVRRRLGARALVEGTNFYFGRRRQGNVELLGQYCRQADIRLEVVEPVAIDGEIVSSSRIRGLVAAGHMERVGRLLTQPYRIRGEVIRGAGRGAKLGYPTANIGSGDTLLPGQGIYAGRAHVDGRRWPAAISLGPNPTFGEDSLKVEVHLIDYHGRLYGRRIEVDFLARLRDIVRFDSVDALVGQMDRDVAATRTIAAQDRTLHGCA